MGGGGCSKPSFQIRLRSPVSLANLRIIQTGTQSSMGYSVITDRRTDVTNRSKQVEQTSVICCISVSDDTMTDSGIIAEYRTL
jgi:hypothetical protein